MSSASASSQNSRRYGPVSLFGPRYVEPSLRIREIRPRFTPPVEPELHTKGSCATISGRARYYDHLDFALVYPARERFSIFECWSERCYHGATPRREWHTGQTGYHGRKAKNKYDWDPVAPQRGPRINARHLGKAVQAMPWHRPWSSLTEPRQVLDCDFTSLGSNAHEMLATRLVYGDELRDFVGKC